MSENEQHDFNYFFMILCLKSYTEGGSQTVKLDGETEGKAYYILL